MTVNRRRFTQFGLLGLSGISALPAFGGEAKRAAKPLKILILGGTGFLGPHIVREVIDRGHTPTLFNRGKSDPHLFLDVEKIKGDRGGPLDALKDRSWDVVIDTSSFNPAQVAKSAWTLKRSVEHYIYISSTAVYKDWSQPELTENSAVFSLEAGKELSAFERYGAAKFDSEKRVTKAYAENSTVIRPNTIVGPGDSKHFRYGYWVRRATQGGEILGPGNPQDPIQYIDARDLAQWIVHCAERRIQGTFNASSPAGAYSMKNMIDDCVSAADAATPTVWVPTDFLGKQDPLDLPFWSPFRDLLPATGHLNVSKAQQHGLQQRPKAQTAEDVLAWYKSLPAEQQAMAVGVPLAREAEVIAAWRKSQAG